MKRLLLITAMLSACGCVSRDEVEEKENEIVQDQMEQYAIAQPVPRFDYSLERDVAIQLYQARNESVATHTVWRSDYGMIEGDTPSIGFPIPYDVQLTNPQKLLHLWNKEGVGVVEQAEPNGLWSSKNSIATWIRAVHGGAEVPIYVEGKVTCYPFPVVVDYATNRVTPAPGAQATITIQKQQEK